MGIAGFDSNWKQIYVNRIFCKTVGWSADELMDAPYPQPYLIQSPEEVNSRQLIDVTDSSASSTRGIEYQFQRKNGTRFWVLIHSNVLSDSGGEKLGTVNLTGTIAAKSNLNCSFSSPNGDNGTFTATYGQGTDRLSSLELVEGTWSYGDQNGFSASAVIDGQGAISGSNSNGCVFSGVVSLMDPGKNIE